MISELLHTKREIRGVQRIINQREDRNANLKVCLLLPTSI